MLCLGLLALAVTSSMAVDAASLLKACPEGTRMVRREHDDTWTRDCRDARGLLHGQEVKYWPKGGPPRTIASWRHGVRHGLSGKWYLSGAPWSLGRFDNGLGAGVVLVWYEAGAL